MSSVGWPGGRRGVLGAVAVFAAAILTSSLLIWHSTEAVFTAHTDNALNNWVSGNVNIVSDAGGQAMFAVSNLTPGQGGSHCIQLTYTGSFPSTVRLFGLYEGGTLSQYLDLTISDGTGGNFGSCSGFTPSGQIYTGNVKDLSQQHYDWPSGVGNHYFTAYGQTRTYKIDYTLDPATPSGQQGATAAILFRWETRS